MSCQTVNIAYKRFSNLIYVKDLFRISNNFTGDVFAQKTQFFSRNSAGMHFNLSNRRLHTEHAGMILSAMTMLVPSQLHSRKIKIGVRTWSVFCASQWNCTSKPTPLHKVACSRNRRSQSEPRLLTLKRSITPSCC